MSSGSAITSDEFVPGRKLLVHVAENGHSFEFECDGATLVEAIQRSIESLCGVHLSDQLLLCRNTSLDSQQILAHYKLPEDGCEVFLYNKSRLHADSPRPSPESIDVPNAAIPSPPSPSRSPHPLDEASDPALKALASYERKFRYHFQFANALYGCSQAKFQVCKRLFRERQVQERALETARGNLDHTFRRLQQRYTEFMKCFIQQNRCHFELLNNFERDWERLRSVKLHPLLQTDSRKCLLDLVKENELRKWAEGCFISHKQFESKVSQLKQNFGELNRKVDNVFLGLDSDGTKDLELMIKDCQKFFNDQKSIMQSLSKDVTTIKKLADDCLNCQLSASLRPHDAVSAIGPMYEVHEKNHLPMVQNCYHTIGKLLDKSLAKKNEMNELVHICMQNVKSAQFSIKDMMNELHAFQEVMGHKEKDFDNLKLVNGISHAYRACLAEVVRRKSTSKLYMGLAGQLAERVATEREAEITRREGFRKSWSKYIPHDILVSMGLFECPSQCDVNIVPFDTNLIDIDITDVDRYAPHSMIGGIPKYENSKSARSCITTSTDSCNMTSFDGKPLVSCEKIDIDLIESCLPVDISGTSKLEVENARLKADLASAIALICTFNAEIGYENFDEIDPGNLLKSIKEKTAEALNLKDDYIKHIQSLLNMKQEQCSTYEKRIQELEQRLTNQYQEGYEISNNKNISESLVSVLKIDDYRGDIFGDGETQNPCVSTVSMEEASCTSASIEPRLANMGLPQEKHVDAVDENMIDFSGMLNMNLLEPIRNVIDASMLETSHDECEAGDVDEERVGDLDRDNLGDLDKESRIRPQKFSLMMRDCSDASKSVLGKLSGEIATELNLEQKTSNNMVLELQSALKERSSQCDINENKLKALEELCSLKKELELSRNLFDESQMNCAHLENCLHEAREEARTNLCAAERRASEYSSLRASAVKMHGLFERFRKYVTNLDEIANFADSLRSFALSLGSSIDAGEDDFATHFQACILIIADKAAHVMCRVEHLSKKMEDQRESIKNLYRKNQLERQASKEKITFLRFEVHELAVFILNTAGNYEAVNRNCPNYYLSSESVALFTDHSSRPDYIVGQIVHIERQIVRPPSPPQASPDDQTEPISSLSSSNPFGLPVGCEYFIVTVAMLPDNTIHSTAS